MTAPEQSTRNRVLAWVAAATVVVAAVGAYLVLGSDDKVDVTAIFVDAAPLYPGNQVKADGVAVGEIDSIELVNGAAQVHMNLDRSILPLHTDAKAIITQQDLLGERFIALERGTPSAPTLDSEHPVLAKANTARSVDLQSILNNVDNPTGTALAAMITTFGEGADKRGADIAAAIQALRPAMQHADELSSILSDQNALLAHLVDSAQPVLRAVAVNKGQGLDAFVGSTNDALTTVANNRIATQDALRRLPATLSSAQRTLAHVANVADSATPTLASIRPVTHDLRDISGELEDFSDAANPALASLRPVLDRGQRLIDEARPVAEALRHGGHGIRDTAAGGRQFVTTALSGPALDDLLQFVKNWALITNGYDGLSNYFRVMPVTTAKALATTGAGPIPGLPDAPVPGVAAPQVPLPGMLAPAPHPKTDHPAPGGTPPGGSATGMDEKQENNLMDQLLGGG
jgi:phospholipid/cholesterol/gamma-HCH transport system substrate-binding protein